MSSKVTCQERETMHSFSVKSKDKHAQLKKPTEDRDNIRAKRLAVTKHQYAYRFEALRRNVGEPRPGGVHSHLKSTTERKEKTIIRKFACMTMRAGKKIKIRKEAEKHCWLDRSAWKAEPPPPPPEFIITEPARKIRTLMRENALKKRSKSRTLMSTAKSVSRNAAARVLMSRYQSKLV